MEEDIKILEELINNYRDCGIDDFPESVIEFGLNKKEVKAIKNLIARNKDLEVEIFAYKNNLGNYTRKVIKEVFNDYLLKSKVKEKIEELLKEYKDNYTNRAKYKVSYAIKILQEILEEN